MDDGLRILPDPRIHDPLMGITGTRWNGPRFGPSRPVSHLSELRHSRLLWGCRQDLPRRRSRTPTAHSSPPMSSPACTCRSSHPFFCTMRPSTSTRPRTRFPLWSRSEDGEDRRCAIGRSAFVLQQPHLERRPRAGSRLHRRAPSGRTRGKNRTRPGLRPAGRPEQGV